MTIPYGHRFEATQALRQTLARAVTWGMLTTNPAKQGVTNRQRPRTERHPFESWDQLKALADRLGPQLGPLVLFAAATGLRPSEWLALELRDIDEQARVVPAPTATAGSNTRRQTRASVPSRCSKSRSRR